MGEFFDLLDEGYERALRWGPAPKQLLELAIASHALYGILGHKWCEEKVRLRRDPDPWMLNGDGEWLKRTSDSPDDARRVVHFNRLIRLSDILTTLLDAKVTGFDVLRERFRTRETKPCFTEAEIASLLVVNGFEVEIKKEQGKRGEDFDLLAKFDGEEINIEVTAKVGDFNLKSLRNTLDQKRKQLPDTGPSALFLHVPPEWMQRPNIYPELTSVIEPFMRGSSRINALVFVWEWAVPLGEGAFCHMNLRPCYSNKARHPFSAIERLTLMAPINGETRTARRLFDRYLRHLQRE